MSVEVLLPSPRVNMLDTGTPLGGVEALAALPTVCGPHRGIRRPSGTNESESDSPPSKKSKKARRRRKRPRQRMMMSMKSLRTKPVAPFNTTQFLMAEHDQLQDTDIVARPRRQRDSSFSVDSDDQNNFYSSPEDEDEFMAREFWNAYEDVHAERLDTMTKAQLVQEYLALEEKVDLLERQLRVVRARHRYRNQHVDDDDDDDDEVRPGEVKVDPETAQKISIFQNEICNLETENRRLREENLTLRRTSSAKSSSSSSSSDSSSDSSSSSSSDSSSDSDDEAGRTLSCKKVSSVVTSVKAMEDEAVVSASDKVECQAADSLVCDGDEETTAGTTTTAAAATTTGPLPDESEEGVCPAHSLSDPPTSSTFVTPVEAIMEEEEEEGEKKREESSSSSNIVEEEVSSTTAA